MSEKNSKWDFFKKPIFWFLFSILIIISIITYVESRKVTKKFVFTDNNLVLNGTDYGIDTLTRVVLSEVYQMDSVDILIGYMPSPLEGVKLDNGLPLAAYIVPHPYKEKSYFIFMSRYLDKTTLLIAITHELVHAKQYYSGDLVKIDEAIYIYKGDTINAMDIEYMERAYERDAYKEESQVIRKLRDILYEKR